MSYATPEEIKLAMTLNYELTQNTRTGSKFVNGARNVWSTFYGWQTADLINNKYTNHLTFDSLSNALKRKL
jgi:hypothetical protein